MASATFEDHPTDPDKVILRKKPYLDKGRDYEEGFVDGMQHQMQSSVDKAVNRMAQPEQEPVATLDDLEQEIYENTRQFVSRNVMEWMLKRYYTTPPQRKPLTPEQIADIVIEMNGNEPTASFWRDLARAIEAAHNIKE